jgi:outer membrane lipoprotein-sorting protein
MTGEDILAAAKAAYARCPTYADTGCVRTVFRKPDGRINFVSTTPFETAFVRPNRFRFEFSTHHPKMTEFSRYLIVENGPEVLTWWDLRPGVERPGSLATAVAGATGVSGASAHTVPALLMPHRVPGCRRSERAALTRLEDAELDGVACFGVERRAVIDPEEAHRFREEAIRLLGWAPPAAESDPDVLWVDQRTFLIRRIESGTRFPTFRTESVTTYQPVVDEDVPDDHLVFDPPEA